MSSAKKLSFVTPRGTLIWPKLITPSTKFDEKGRFETVISLDPGAAQDLIAELDKILDAQATITSSEKRPFFKDEIDKETGKPTGNIRMSFSTGAKGKSRNGEEFTRKIALFDARGKPISGIEPWTGTLAKVSFKVKPTEPREGKVGLRLYLDAVQILQLVQAPEQNGERFGFGEEEGFDIDAFTDSGADDCPFDGEKSEGDKSEASDPGDF